MSKKSCRFVYSKYAIVMTRRFGHIAFHFLKITNFHIFNTDIFLNATRTRGILGSLIAGYSAGYPHITFGILVLRWNFGIYTIQYGRDIYIFHCIYTPEVWFVWSVLACIRRTFYNYLYIYYLQEWMIKMLGIYLY